MLKHYDMELKIVSFKLATKLKEIGFDLSINTAYRNNRHQRLILLDEAFIINSIKESIIAAPTQALVQMWFRKKYNIHILITPDSSPNPFYTFSFIYYFDTEEEYEDFVDYSSYEEALEIGLLRICNIIKNETL